MGAPRKPDLDRRLDAYFTTLRTSSVKEALKRSAGNWHIYAAVTSSAVAMVTGASASTIGSGIRDITTAPAASVRLAKQQLASSKHAPYPRLLNSVRLAMARQDARQRLFSGAADVITGHASQAQAPSISAGAVVPVYSAINTIQPGEWVSIYGSNLASGIATSNGDFPTSLGGTSVLIDGKPAYLLYVSPGQINLQAPDDTATGMVSVVVTTAAGSATSSVTLSNFAPSFMLLDTAHVAAIIPRSNGSGAHGGGAYDILGPTGTSLGYPTVAAQPGDIVELYAVGFGPTTPAVPAGEVFSGAAPINNTITLTINNVLVKPTFVGLSSAGLYQINLIVPPRVGQGDVPLRVIIGGMQTQQGVLFSLRNSSTVVSTYPVTGGGSNPGTFFFSSNGGGSGGGTGGGTGGGSGGGSARTPTKKKPYEPRLQFPPK
jgi:uncharacterized protein (TIGR03437 family)